MSVAEDQPIVSFASQAAWEAWLAKHGGMSNGVWLKIAKKHTGVDSVSYPQAVDVSLCYGWIDGQARSFDDTHWLQKFTPRRPRSRWSKINCAKATVLIATGLMTPAGLREVERAKADGRWEAAYAGQSAATVPDDLQRELTGNPTAAAFFATLSSANRYAILYRIHDAKRPGTRAQRIATFVAMLNEGRTLH